METFPTLDQKFINRLRRSTTEYEAFVNDNYTFAKENNDAGLIDKIIEFFKGIAIWIQIVLGIILCLFSISVVVYCFL